MIRSFLAITTGSVSKTTFIDLLYKRIDRIPQTFPPMRVQPFPGLHQYERGFLPPIPCGSEQCSLLISVDSWSKYVAGWKRIPQVVIVPDQTPDYPQLSASAVWRYSFRGLHKEKNLTLLGLDPTGNRRAHYTFGAMSALRPNDILEVIPR